MVLIISRNDEITTDLVIDWLRSYKIPYKRINDDLYRGQFWDVTGMRNFFQEIDLDRIKVVWFRKYEGIFDKRSSTEIINRFGLETLLNLQEELRCFREYILQELYRLDHIKWVTSKKKATENKLIEVNS